MSPSRALWRPLLLAALIPCTSAGALEESTPGRAGTTEPRGTEPRVELLRSEGIKHYNDRRYFQAIRAFESALDMVGPDRAPEFKQLIARARSALGVELFNSGEIRQASEAFQEALRQSEDSYAQFGLGLIAFVRIDDAKALEHLNEALRLEPSSGKTHKLLGLLDYRQGRTAEALTKMEKALKLDAQDREASALIERWKAESEVTGRFADRESRGLVLRSDPLLSLDLVEDIGRRLEGIRRQIGTAFQLEITQKVVVVLFSPERFYKATKSYHWVGGFYDGQIKLPVSGGSRPSPDELNELDEALRHETTHVVVRQVCPECPNWLNEGLAQHFEKSGRADGINAQLRAKPSARIRFEDVPSRLWEVDDEDLARRTYLQGLSFVEFLVDRFLEFRLRILLDTIRREGSLRKAFELVYGLRLEEAEALWWKGVEEGAGKSKAEAKVAPPPSQEPR